MSKIKKELIRECLKQSNYIEGEYDEQSLKDAERAWRYWEQHKEEPLTVALVLKLHELLMRNLKPRIAGKLRTCDVWIGGVRKQFVGLETLELQLKEVISEMNKPAVDTEYCKLCHINFEGLHPFEDGNGRIGRMLLNIQLIKNGFQPMLILERERGLYYQWFKKVDLTNI